MKWESSRCLTCLEGGKAGMAEEKKRVQGGGRNEETHQVLRRGGGMHPLFELCKIAVWEQRGVCLCVRLCV